MMRGSEWRDKEIKIDRGEKERYHEKGRHMREEAGGKGGREKIANDQKRIWWKK